MLTVRYWPTYRELLQECDVVFLHLLSSLLKEKGIFIRTILLGPKTNSRNMCGGPGKLVVGVIGGTVKMGFPISNFISRKLTNWINSTEFWSHIQYDYFVVVASFCDPDTLMSLWDRAGNIALPHMLQGLFFFVLY